MNDALHREGMLRQECSARTRGRTVTKPAREPKRTVELYYKDGMVVSPSLP